MQFREHLLYQSCVLKSLYLQLMQHLFLHLIASVVEIPIENFLVTGHDTGHVGSADILIGLDRLIHDGGINEPYLVAGSTPYAFGSGLLMPA